MKTLKIIITLVICIGLMLGATSCVVFTPKHSGPKQGQGYHKNSNNPHHPYSTNPGKAKGHDKK